MQRRDIAAMAFGNLWSRKLRTAMNLFGIVLGCVVLLMTLAGTRGVAQSFEAMIEGSEDARKFMLHQGWSPKAKPPEEVLLVQGDMSEERRKRIQKHLEARWLEEFAEKSLFNQEKLQQLREIPHVIEVVPQTHLPCQIKLSSTPASQEPQSEQRRYATGISLIDSRLNSRVFIGQPLLPDDQNGILLSEFTAYQMGYKTDEELASLIGQAINISFLLRGQIISSLVQQSNWMSDNPVDLTGTLQAIEKLLENMDATPLTEAEQAQIRSVFKKAQTPSATDHPSATDNKDPQFETRQFEIRGIIRASTEDDPHSLLRKIYVSESPDVYLPHPVAIELQMSGDDFRTFYGAIAAVDDVRNLKSVTQAVEELGFQSNSVLWFVQMLERDVGNARMAISALSLLILIIAAIGMSNTMVVSVLERTGEFGILKAIGARDRHLLSLMLFEGIITGVLGATCAVVGSMAISQLVAFFVRRQISQQLNFTFTDNIFAFTALEFVIVFAVAITTCALASLLPAWRAAKLDPVVAMRRN